MSERAPHISEEMVGETVDALDAALGFSKNLGPMLSREMERDAAQHALRRARDVLREACVGAAFDPWGDNHPWEA